MSEPLIVRALLLAAGIGSRLRPITDTVPKCLVPIHGRPLLAYWIDIAFRGGIERALINTHYLPEQVRDFIAQSPWRNRIDLVHETELLGTGGTVLANRDYFRREAFLLAHADNLTELDASWLARAHQTRPAGCAITMLAFRTDDPRSCGIVELDAHGVVQAFHEKVDNPPGNLANAAVYVIDPEIVDFIAGLGRHIVDFSTEVIPAFLGRIMVVETRGYHRDIGNVESLRRAHLEFRPPSLVPRPQ